MYNIKPLTTNPKWPEITDQLGPHQTAYDRPDNTMTVFKGKFLSTLSNFTLNTVIVISRLSYAV